MEKMNWENAMVSKKSGFVARYSNLYSFHLVHWAQLCWSLKRLCSHSPDIHGSSIFWVMCLSNLYIKSNVSRELKLLRSEIIAFCVSFIRHFFFPESLCLPFLLSSHSLQTLHLCRCLTFFLCLLSKDHLEDGK